MDTTLLRRAALAVAAAALAACQPSAPQPPQQPNGVMPPGQYAPFGQYAAPQVQGAPPPGNERTLGPALTPFGILAQLPQLAQLPSQSPQQLPDIGSWMRTYWPLPQSPSQPPAQPQPQQQPPSWPMPGVPGLPGVPGGGSTAQEDEVLALTNQRRAQGASCGGQVFGPAGPLAHNAQLQAAARNHSRDMATRGYFSHQSPEGAGPSDRARAAGYPSGFIGENIAAGYPTPAAVVEGWMQSPGHCLNIMEPRYRYLGVGHHAGSRSYWTQNFGG
jgi:uncharacterized protein YkwD